MCVRALDQACASTAGVAADTAPAAAASVPPRTEGVLLARGNNAAVRKQAERTRRAEKDVPRGMCVIALPRNAAVLSVVARAGPGERRALPATRPFARE
jgi:hypothetical protein